jgi:hypothetical protein
MFINSIFKKFWDLNRLTYHLLKLLFCTYELMLTGPTKYSKLAEVPGVARDQM